MRILNGFRHAVIIVFPIIGFALCCPVAQASFHSWDINEIFSNEDGTIQFIEMRETQGLGGQHQMTVSASYFTTNTHNFTYDMNLTTGSTIY